MTCELSTFLRTEAKARLTNDDGIHELLTEAADKIDWQHAQRLELDRRIHNQRLALQKNWEIIEMRAQYKRCWYPSKLLTAILQRVRKGHIVPPAQAS